MPKEKLILDLAFLKTSDHPCALIWRVLRTHGMMTYKDLSRVSESRYAFNRLKSEGWIQNAGKRRDDADYRSNPTYKALTEPMNQSKPDLNGGIKSARNRLTRLAEDAHKARRTGLAHEMGRCLRKIEGESREIRSLLRLRSRTQ